MYIYIIYIYIYIYIYLVFILSGINLFIFLPSETLQYKECATLAIFCVCNTLYLTLFYILLEAVLSNSRLY